MSLPKFSSLSSIGAFLREQRESKHLTLHTVAHDTHIRLAYLDALEQGLPQSLPDLVYVRGFLGRYGDYLGLDGRALSQSWAELGGEQPRDPQKNSRRQEPVITLSPVHLWGVYVGMVILTVSSLAYVVGGSESPLVRWWQAWQTDALSRPDPTSDLRTEVVVTEDGATLLTPDLGSAPEPQDNSAPPPITSAQVPADPIPADQVLVAIQVVDRPSWIRVIADNRTVLEDTLQPGTEMSWSASDSIVVRAGNAGGVAVTWNNQPQGVLGNFGEVTEIVYSRTPPPRDP